MTHDDVIDASVGENRRHFSTEDTPCLRSGTSGDVDALAVELNAVQTCDIVGSEMRGDGIASGDGHGESASVGGKAVGQSMV